ncbi:MAG: response regulator transcription factor [Rhodospirillaceae bacterium]|nr:response regulator transcription factor [Rhodospirillaceae bacterium]MBT3928867.1 response regulator transcription factor [Rhodospirillaceae bacterium]MBT4427058.1 response regulator transcription factor [Rhodospirillaceae bacterium]
MEGRFSTSPCRWKRKVVSELQDQYTIYIVDDDDAVRDSLRTLLEAVGWSVQSYESGMAFLNICDSTMRGCLLLDIRMPGLDGLQVQRILSQRGVTLPFIVISGHGDVSSAVRAMKAGAAEFLEKPFDSEIVLRAIRTALESDAEARGKQAVASAAAARLDALTRRERQVFDCLVEGAQNKMIARQLAISPRTVEVHRSRIMKKLGASSLSEVVHLALEAGAKFDDA